MNSSNRSSTNKVLNKQNTENFSKLTDETIVKEITEKNLSFAAICKLRQTCGFFAYHPKLTELWKKKRQKIVVSNRKTFIIRDNLVFAMGDNEFNGLGLEQKKFYYELELVILPNNIGAVNVIASTSKTFLVDNEGTYYKCGGGYGDFNTALTPIQLPNNELIIEIVPGDHQFFIRTNQNNWYGCGSNNCGQLGLEARYQYVDKPMLITLQNGPAINKVVSGWGCTYFCDKNGQWHVCGTGYGLGLNHFKNIYSPIPVFLPNNKPIIDVKLGFESFFICDKDGQWHACGSNRNNELGLGPAYTSFVLTPQPIQLTNGKRITKIVATTNRTFFCDEDGQWHGCGYCNDGGLGINFQFRTTNIPTPIHLSNGYRIIDVIAIDSHTFFCDDHYHWHGCGSNEQGELGLPSTMKNQFLPVQIDFSKLETKIEAHDKLRQDNSCRMK